MKKIIILLLFFSLLLLAFFSLMIGSHSISFNKVLQIIIDKIFSINFNQNITDNDYLEKIIFNIRLPRILLSILAGISLSISGLVYQTLLKNPLAEPFTLGVSSGVTFGAALSIFISDFIIGFRLSIFPFSFIGGSSTLLLLSILILKKNISLFTLIFIGISVSYFFNALLTLLLSLLGDRSYDVLLWMFGSFSNAPSPLIFLFYFLVVAVVFFILLFSSHKLDIFYLSDEIVLTSGINLNFYRIFFLAITSIITIFTVSICGIIGFVGLIIPHISKIIFGSKHKYLLLSSSILGAILLLLSDNFARSFMSVISDYGKEIPVGVVTSLIGVPFFVYFLIKNRSLI